MARDRRLSRRAFVGAAAGATLPYFIPEGVLAQPGRPGANERIVVASIGVGGMGRNHVFPDVAALCDVDSTRMAEVAKSVMESGKRDVPSPPDLVQ